MLPGPRANYDTIAVLPCLIFGSHSYSRDSLGIFSVPASSAFLSPGFPVQAAFTIAASLGHFSHSLGRSSHSRILSRKKEARQYVALRVSSDPFCSAAQRSASTTLRNSASRASPMVFTKRPLWAAMAGPNTSWRSAWKRARVPPQSHIADDISDEDGSEPALHGCGPFRPKN